MWNIERIVSKGDYLYAVVLNHPNRTINNYVLLHRVIVENKLGRLLGEHEVVHHKNHNKMDNRAENLEVLTEKEHLDKHKIRPRKVVVLKCPWCKKIFEKSSVQTHLVKRSQTYTSCSKQCTGRFSTSKKDEKYLQAIEENVIRTYVQNEGVQLHFQQKELLLDDQYLHIPVGRNSIRARQKEKDAKVCLTCGEEFNPAKRSQKYCSANCTVVKKGNYPQREVLEKLLWEKPSTKVAEMVGVSDVALGKWCRKFNISKPPRGYWASLRSK